MEIDKSGHSVRAMFSAIAGRYDLLNHLLSANQDRRWRRRAIRLLLPRKGERILDLCCGTGDLAIECLRQQPGCKVIGADFAVPMLHIAKRKVGA
ncbi:MAG TPA: class I SAM-dependent methyltransferase, partial [Gammaproteobacteria bacterium]|nr:class I SAM-dependent methyltransferase [Gammaproteobacteria bacterium]